MIYYFTPYEKGNLGKAYNHYCSIVPKDDDWITIMDGDVMMLHTNWADIWSRIVSKHKTAGLITCITNRIALLNKDQLCVDQFEETDILNHTKYARQIFAKNKYKTSEITGDFLSGLFFAFKKSTWKNVGGFMDGILDVDKDFYEKVKKEHKCLVARGFYVLHYYRMLEDIKFGRYIEHLL